MRVLALIPARGGSKGVPRKNVRDIAGRPLIAWTIAVARAARGIDAVVVSTEDPEIAAVARNAGADVPFTRPTELAADDTPGIAPVLHALSMLPGYDALLLLQPTSPLRAVADVEGVLALTQASGAPTIVSTRAAGDHPAWMYTRDDTGALVRLDPTPAPPRRQDLPPLFVPNGAVYFAHTEWLIREQTFVGPGTLGYEMPAERSIDIDTPLDWRIAEMLLTGSIPGGQST